MTEKHPTWSIELWSINRWLRWTGFRLFVAVDTSDLGPDTSDSEDRKPTRIGLVWWGY
jgi:hypothetical protein